MSGFSTSPLRPVPAHEREERGANASSAAGHAAEDATRAGHSEVDRNERTSRSINETSGQGRPLTEAEWEAKRIDAAILSDALAAHPQGQKWFAQRIGRKPQQVSQWCSPVYSASMPSRFISFMSPSQLRVYLAGYRGLAEGRSTQPVMPLSDAIHAGMAEAMDVPRKFLELKAKGELTAADYELIEREAREGEEALSQVRLAARAERDRLRAAS